MPLTISGVPSSLNSGRAPRLSVLKRQATSSLLKLLPLIWSRGEYLLPRKSAGYIGHSPLLVLGCPVAAAWPACPEARGAATHASPLPSNARAGNVRNNLRNLYFAAA